MGSFSVTPMATNVARKRAFTREWVENHSDNAATCNGHYHHQWRKKRSASTLHNFKIDNSSELDKCISLSVFLIIGLMSDLIGHHAKFWPTVASDEPALMSLWQLSSQLRAFRAMDNMLSMKHPHSQKSLTISAQDLKQHWKAFQMRQQY